MRYLSARFQHDLMNKDPEKRKKITGVIFEIGYSCKQSCDCCHGYECKYRPDWRYHNWSIEFRRWIHEKTGLDIKFPWYFQKKRVDFSGTTKCPYNMPRLYNCYQCAHLKPGDGEFGLACHNPEYLNHDWSYSHDEDTPRGRCKFFKVDPCYENYNRNTGELPWEV